MELLSLIFCNNFYPLTRFFFCM